MQCPALCRPPTPTCLRGAAPPWPQGGVSAALPAAMKWFWTGTGCTACKGTCWWRTSSTCTNKGTPGRNTHLDFTSTKTTWEAPMRLVSPLTDTRVTLCVSVLFLWLRVSMFTWHCWNFDICGALNIFFCCVCWKNYSVNWDKKTPDLWLTSVLFSALKLWILLVSDVLTEL